MEGSRQQLRILVVEDEKTVLLMIGRDLCGRGHVVTAVATGDSARATGGTFDVGVFDIHLGDESGVDVAAGLLASKRVAALVTVSTRVKARLAPTSGLSSSAWMGTTAMSRRG